MFKDIFYDAVSKMGGVFLERKTIEKIVEYFLSICQMARIESPDKVVISVNRLSGDETGTATQQFATRLQHLIPQIKVISVNLAIEMANIGDVDVNANRLVNSLRGHISGKLQRYVIGGSINGSSGADLYIISSDNAEYVEIADRNSLHDDLLFKEAIAKVISGGLEKARKMTLDGPFSEINRGAVLVNLNAAQQLSSIRAEAVMQPIVSQARFLAKSCLNELHKTNTIPAQAVAVTPAQVMEALQTSAHWSGPQLTVRYFLGRLHGAVHSQSMSKISKIIDEIDARKNRRGGLSNWDITNIESLDIIKAKCFYYLGHYAMKANDLNHAIEIIRETNLSQERNVEMYCHGMIVKWKSLIDLCYIGINNEYLIQVRSNCDWWGRNRDRYSRLSHNTIAELDMCYAMSMKRMCLSSNFAASIDQALIYLKYIYDNEMVRIELRAEALVEAGIIQSRVFVMISSAEFKEHGAAAVQNVRRGLSMISNMRASSATIKANMAIGVLLSIMGYENKDLSTISDGVEIIRKIPGISTGKPLYYVISMNYIGVSYMYMYRMTKDPRHHADSREIFGKALNSSKDSMLMIYRCISTINSIFLNMQQARALGSHKQLQALRDELFEMKAFLEETNLREYLRLLRQAAA